MKHESNDTPPFAPDDPISRSLFVRPNLIERLCASALRLCLLVCIPAAASVFLISLADSAEAACTSEPSQHYEVTTLIADHPVQTSSDPDFEEILKANARIAVESGEWSRRVKRKEETLIQWMRSPVFPEFRPMAVKTTLIRRPTGLSVEDIRRARRNASRSSRKSSSPGAGTVGLISYGFGFHCSFVRAAFHSIGQLRYMSTRLSVGASSVSFVACLSSSNAMESSTGP